jgi:DNA-binding XRE family transcriptional regulator
MQAPLFDNLVTGFREAGQIKRGKATAGRRHVLESVDVQAVRKKMRLSQSTLALLMGVSVQTLQNWSRAAVSRKDLPWRCWMYSRAIQSMRCVRCTVESCGARTGGSHDDRSVMS